MIRQTIAFTLLGLVLAVAGCGGGDNNMEQVVASDSVLAAAPPLNKALISGVDLRGAPAGSPKRAFLELWSLLQHQALADAVDLYDPSLTAAVGADRLAGALEYEAPFYRASRPHITRLRATGPGKVLVLYTVTDLKGGTVPQSMAFIKRGGAWLVRYDPFLDEALRISVQTATQNAINPLARTPGRKALQAGERAKRLQSRYITADRAG